MIEALRTWSRASRFLTFAVWFHLALTLFALIALPIDHRHILGLNPWIKPLKFDLSTIIFLVTTAVLLRLMEPAFPRLRRLVAVLVSAAMIVENSVISLQSFRGVRSHMNFTSAFNSSAFALMGVFIIVNTVAVALLFLLWCRAHPHLPPAITLGARLGLAVFLAGSLEGTVMVGHFAHTIGAKDGGPGLPFLDWSTTHGDLRIAHFFALHCLQAMLLLGWLLSRTTWRPNVQLTTLTVVFALYLTSVWLLFHQAMAGHPLLS